MKMWARYSHAYNYIHDKPVVLVVAPSSIAPILLHSPTLRYVRCICGVDASITRPRLESLNIVYAVTLFART